MSYAHTQRRKLIRRLKRKHIDRFSKTPDRKKWLPEFFSRCDQAATEIAGPCLGTLQDALDAMEAAAQGA